MDPGVRRELHGTGQHRAVPLHFCSSSPVAPFTSHWIGKDLPWRMLVPLWKGKRKSLSSILSLERTVYPLQVSPAQNCLLGKQILHPWRGLTTFWGCSRKCWICSSCSVLVGWGTVISIPSPSTWRLQDRTSVIVLHVFRGNVLWRVYAQLGESFPRQNFWEVSSFFPLACMPRR